MESAYIQVQAHEQTLNSFINIPWRDEGEGKPSFQGCRCWGLVQLYFDAVRGIELPNLMTMPSAEYMKKWHQVPLTKVQHDDILVFRISRYEHHVGIVVTSQTMLHVEKGSTSCIEDYRGIKWKDRLLKAYRYIQ